MTHETWKVSWRDGASAEILPIRATTGETVRFCAEYDRGDTMGDVKFGSDRRALVAWIWSRRRIHEKESRYSLPKCADPELLGCF